MKGGQKDEFLCFRQVLEERKKRERTFSASATAVLGTIPVLNNNKLNVNSC